MSDFPAPSYDGALERTANGGVIRFERHLPYPIRDVWDAITNPARLAEWLRPFDAASYVRWELELVDTGCVLRLSHFVTDTAGAIDNCYVVGLHASLARLAPCLAGRPVAWDWDGFAEAQAHYASIGLAPPVDAS